MPERRLSRQLLLALVLALAAPGCLFHVYRPVTVLVRDAETKKPIPGAEVDHSYITMLDPFAPLPSRDTTQADGTAHLVAAPYDCLSTLTAEAKGYLRETYTVKGSDLRAVDPADWFKARDRRPITFVLEKYAEPQ